MTEVPSLLDLCCCEGAASIGYARAGFDVTGVDIEQRFSKRYPGHFVMADAIEYLADHGSDFDAIHISPPCQAYTAGTRAGDRARYPRLIEPARELLCDIGVPYVIENVPGAPLINPITLCGSMFGLTATDDDGTPLRLERHRAFESNIWLWATDCHHDARVQVGGVYGGGRTNVWEARNLRHGGYTPRSKVVRAALIGVDPVTFTMHGLSQAIPPAYTEFIGHQLREALAS